MTSREEQLLYDRVDQLVRDLERPMYVYRMARANKRMLPGQEKRMLNAARQLEAVAEAYGKEAE